MRASKEANMAKRGGAALGVVLSQGRRRILRGIAAAILIALSQHPRATANERVERVDAAVVFLVDVSGSMDVEEQAIVRHSHAQALLSADVLGLLATRRFAFAYVEFATHAAVRVDWTLIDSAAAAQAFVARVVAPGVSVERESTSISAGMILADDLFDALPWKADRLVVDVVGDGANNTRPALAPARQRLLERGAVINGVPLTIRPAQAGLEHIYRDVIGGEGSFYIPLHAGESEVHETGGMLGMQRFPGLPSVLRQKLLRELL
jgi:hypothetical protein